MHRHVTPFAVAALFFTSAPAAAWQIEDPLHLNCHERLTQAALDAVGYIGTPPDPNEDELALLNSAQFDLSQYDDNPWAWALIIGVRFPDLKGAPSFDFDDLSRVHNALDAQDEHCLRSEAQDGPEGDKEALAACRNVITAAYWEALGSLDDDGNVDPNVKTFAAENLVFAGRVDVELSEHYFAAGRGLHAIQDGFTHTFRDPADFRAVHTVFNWSDQVSCELDEPRDGHPHESLLDDCEGTFDSNVPRMEATQLASAQFLAALKEPGNRRVREQRLQEFLDEWFSLRSECAFDNAYCEHPEQAFFTETAPEESDLAICEGCSSTSSASSRSASAWWAVLGLGLLGLRRRARSSSRSSSRAGAHTGVALALTLCAAPALAQDAPSTDAPAAGATTTDAPPDAPTPADAPSDARSDAASTTSAATASTASTTDAPAEAAPAGPKDAGYRTEVRASMSVQNPGTAIGVAAGYRWLRFDVGAFGELNPWFSVERSRVSLGTTNLGAFFHYLHPISPDADLRFGAGGGVSILNESLAGSPAGKIGPYLNLRLLGVVWHGEDFALTLDGFDLAVAAPQMVGWPVVYAQHRISVGVQF